MPASKDHPRTHGNPALTLMTRLYSLKGHEESRFGSGQFGAGTLPNGSTRKEEE
jgi:hypothetical protein